MYLIFNVINQVIPVPYQVRDKLRQESRAKYLDPRWSLSRTAIRGGDDHSEL